MGLFSKALGRRGPHLDLLAATFGLGLPMVPSGRVGGKNGRTRTEYDSGDDDDDGMESESEGSVSSDDEEDSRVERQPSPKKKRDKEKYKGKKEKKSLSKRRHYHRHHRRSSSSLSNLKRESIPPSTSRRSSTHIKPKHLAASHVRPSATFPPRTALHLPGQPCVIPASSSAFSASTLNQPFGAVPIRQPQQPVYYQNSVAFVPSRPSTAQVPVQAAQYVASTISRPTSASITPRPPVEKPKEPSHGRALSDWAEDSGPYAKELQRIQKRIDGKMSDLSKEPTNPNLRSDLRGLQDKLNSTLNKAITGKGTMHARLPSTSTMPASPLPRLKSPKFSFSETRVTRTPFERELQGQREKGTEREKRFHFCSQCGVARSAEFHEAYPFPPGGASKLCICSSCQEKKVERGVADGYHFCFSCGCARSKQFHKKHPILPGEPILQNYCMSCRMEIQGGFTLAEMSVIGSVSPDKNGRKQRVAPLESDDEDDSMAPQCTGTGTRKQYAVKEQPRKSPAAPEGRAVSRRRQTPMAKKYRDRYRTDEETPSRCQEAKGKDPRGRRSEPLDIEPNDRDVSPFSPGYPTRMNGSASRRAQRRQSSEQTDAETVPQPEKPANYRAPYIEDLASGPHSREQTPTPFKAHVRERERDRPSSGLVKGKSSSGRPRRAREHSPEPTRPRDGSVESDSSAGSDPTSSKSSSSSKTVRFKESLDIRTALPTDTDTSEAEADTPLDKKRSFRPPSSPLISRQQTGFYDTREKEKDARYYLHPHRARSSMKSPGSGFRTPDRFRESPPSQGYSQGAFSRDFDDFYASPRPAPESKFTDHSGSRSHFDYPADQPKDTHGDYEEYMESTTSLPSFLPSGGGFGSFFNKSKSKASAAPGSRASPFAPGHNFNEAAGDH